MTSAEPAPRITLAIPETFLDREITFRVAKSGSRWIIEAEDKVGCLFDVNFPGYTGVVKFATKSGAVAFAEKAGLVFGPRHWSRDFRA